MKDAPKWMTSTRINKVADRVQSQLEWTIRRAEVFWYQSEEDFQRAHGTNGSLVAFAKKNANTIHLSPKITTQNFDEVFAHELVHIVAFQKYKEAIPAWLEEGLANYIGKNARVDYKWLSTQPLPADVLKLAHPLYGTAEEIHFRYAASQALAEMLAKKCDLKNLLRLSVGRKMENYISTYCGIKNLNATFQSWVRAKSS